MAPSAQPQVPMTEQQMRTAYEKQMQRHAQQHMLEFLGRPDPIPGSAGLDTVTRLQDKIDAVTGLFGGCVGQVWQHARPVSMGSELGQANTALAKMWASEIGQSMQELRHMIDTELVPHEPAFEKLRVCDLPSPILMH